MATSDRQEANIESYAPATRTETVTRTVVLPLESSNRKRAKLERAIGEFRDMCMWLGDHMVTLPEHEWTMQNTTLYRMVTREFPDEERTVNAKVALSAARHVVSNYKSWLSNGRPGDRPSFDDVDFLSLDTQQFDILENDRGYGIKANFIPYKPEWFHVSTRPYTRQHLADIFDGVADYGGAEFHVEPDGLYCHLPVQWPVEVYEPSDLSTYVGVDIGERTLYAAAVRDGGGVEAVDVEPGREFRHYRDRLADKRERLSEQGDLRGVRACQGDRIKYTEQVLDTASKQIVQLAVDHAPACIRLEDLAGYRETAADPIHDWPFDEFQRKIAYKATAERVPVEFVNPRDSSVTCRKCGQRNRDYRDGDRFDCTRCGYQVHADVNAAMNIAAGGVTD